MSEGLDEALFAFVEALGAAVGLLLCEGVMLEGGGAHVVWALVGDHVGHVVEDQRLRDVQRDFQSVLLLAEVAGILGVGLALVVGLRLVRRRGGMHVGVVQVLVDEGLALYANCAVPVKVRMVPHPLVNRCCLPGVQLRGVEGLLGLAADLALAQIEDVRRHVKDVLRVQTVLGQPAVVIVNMLLRYSGSVVLGILIPSVGVESALAEHEGARGGDAQAALVHEVGGYFASRVVLQVLAVLLWVVAVKRRQLMLVDALLQFVEVLHCGVELRAATDGAASEWAARMNGHLTLEWQRLPYMLLVP